MKLNYTITAADFLEYLYIVSTSAVISGRRNIAKYSFSFIYAFFGISKLAIPVTDQTNWQWK